MKKAQKDTYFFFLYQTISLRMKITYASSKKEVKGKIDIVSYMRNLSEPLSPKPSLSIKKICDISILSLVIRIILFDKKHVHTHNGVLFK